MWEKEKLLVTSNFSFSLQCFQKVCSVDSLKPGLVWERVKHFISYKLKWGWTTSSDNLESALPLQNNFNDYFHNSDKCNKFISNICTEKKKKRKEREKNKVVYRKGGNR